MNPIVIQNNLPATLVALSSETLAEVARINAAGVAIRSIDSIEEMEAADKILAAASKLDKAIEAERKRMKAPILALAEALDAAASEARTPLVCLKAELGRLVLAFQQAENARREAERRRIEEERRAAAEAARKAEVERLAAAEAARLAAAAAAELPPWEQPDEQPAAPAPEPVVIVPEVLPPERQMAVAPIKSRAVTQRTIARLVVDDPALIPRSVAGVDLWKLDEAAVLKLLKAGVAVPGCHLTTEAAVAAKG